MPSMTTPARNTLAVVGAGPIGLEAALAGLDQGLDVHVFEQGEAGSHPIAWGHVRMFTPWRMNIGGIAARHLAAAGWTAPAADAFPTGAELAEQLLAPIAALPALAGRLHTHAQVVSIGRRGALKGDAAGEARGEAPFRLLVRDAGGRENFLHAHAVIDASGVYAQPNLAGTGGIPARSELYLRPQLAYHPEDVLGLSRATYAGKRTLVLGGGASAATTIAALARLATEAEGTTAVWVTRKPAAALFARTGADPLPERAALAERARALASGAEGAVTHVGGAEVEGLEFNSATHRYRVTLLVGEQPRVEEVDRVIVNTGFGPDASLYRELQVDESATTRGPAALARAIAASGARDCLTVPAFDIETLATPEPGFFILGHKSYGRNSDFLLQTGYRQVADVVAHLAARVNAGSPA